MVTALLVVAVDQGTKQLVNATIDRNDSVNLALGFKLSNVRNDGVAFGLLGGAGTLVLVLTLVTMAVLLGYFAVRTNDQGAWLAIGLVMGGAAGNLIDRIRLGAAIDFIDPPAWPAFNIADVAIVTGVFLLGLSILAVPDHDRE